jgi:transcriptional regulator with XRE-family HTH domain
MIERSRSTLLPALAAHRRRYGLTQRQLGELAGVAHTTVQRLESLSRGAYPRTVRKLALALGVEPADLVGSEPTARFTVVGLLDDSRHARNNLGRLGR